MNIIEAMTSKALFGPDFARMENGIDSWESWKVFLRAMFALPISEANMEINTAHTGRTDVATVPYNEVSLICGRRAGKTRIISLIGLYLAVFGDYSKKLARGEKGVVAIVAADMRQAVNCIDFIKGLLRGVPSLERMIVAETVDSVTLDNRIVIEVFPASFRLTRGSSLVAALLDELAFFRTADTSANVDTDIVAALRPGLANLGGPLIMASSPYARRGALWNSYKAFWGVPAGRVLCWQGSSREMNPSLPAGVVDAAYADDPQSAMAEYGAIFRNDLSSYVDRAVVESATIPGRYELPPKSGVAYTAFVDPAGGSGGDSYALGVAHREGDLGILDCVRERKPPFSPEQVTQEYAELLRSYRIAKVTGDAYAGEYPRELFRKAGGISYELSTRSKSDIMRDGLPLLNSGRLELLDHRVLAAQLVGLERRTARSGRDSIDHAPGGHDDVAVSAMGALLAIASRPSVGELWERLAG